MEEGMARKRMAEILNCSLSSVYLLGGYSNQVYEVSLPSPLVVKLYRDDAYPEQLVLSELEWVRYLFDHGVPTVEPVLLRGGAYLNRISESDYFVAFKKACGVHMDPSDIQVWNEALFLRWGLGMGRMHSFSADFRGKYRRPEWAEQEIYSLDPDLLEPGIREKWKDSLERLRRIPRANSTYGLIHGDLHHHNFLVDRGELTFLDFGDSEYHWFAYDIAIAVYHAALTVTDIVERRKFSKVFQVFHERVCAGFSGGAHSAASGLLYFLPASLSPGQMEDYWLNEYFPGMMRNAIAQMPAIETVTEALEARGFRLIGCESLLVQPDLQDLFLYSGKFAPEIYLNPQVRAGISSFAALADPDEVEEGLRQLDHDLRNGIFKRKTSQYISRSGDYLFIVAEKEDRLPESKM